MVSWSTNTPVWCGDSMIGPGLLASSRLDIIPATVDLYRLELDYREGLALALDAEVPAEWPPEQVTREVIEEFITRIEAEPGRMSGFYWVLRGDRNQPRVLIGSGGFFRYDEEVMELGYSVLPAWQGKGYTTEAVGVLVDWAFTCARARRIVAYTYPDLAASIRVLEKNGFRYTGAGPEDGTIAYERCQPYTR